MPDLNEAIRQFDATESNLKRLEEMWKEIKTLIPRGMVAYSESTEAVRYAALCRTFKEFCQAMPRIDNCELSYQLLDSEAIFQSRFDAAEIGEPDCAIATERHIYSQGDTLQEYRFRFDSRRRRLVRTAMKSTIEKIDVVLVRLAPIAEQNGSPTVAGQDWADFKHLIDQIAVLQGTAYKTPRRWSDLRRHLGFGQAGDLYDIVKHDWPVIKEDLLTGMFGPDDPLPVHAPDLGALVDAAPSGPVITALKWDAIDADAFERLIYNLVSDAEGYSNPQWLTNVEAPDRGRDISVNKTVGDSLSGSRVYRVIIQCKHWRTKSVSVDEVGSSLIRWICGNRRRWTS